MLKQKLMVQFGSNAITYLIGMVAGIVVARIAGPEVMGTMAFATAYVGIFGFINGIFGAPHIKLVSEGRNHAECMAIITRISIITGALYFAAVLGWFLIQKYLLHYPFEGREVQIVIMLTLVTHLLHKYEGYAETVFTANLKQAKANFPVFLRTILYHLGRIGVVLLGGAAIAMSAWSLFLMIAFIPVIHHLLREYPIGKYNPELAKDYFRLSLPMVVIVVVNSVTGYADKLLLAHFTNTTELGYFSAANSIGGAFMLIALPVGQVFFPLFSGLISKGDWGGVSNNIRKYQEVIALFVFPLICLLATIGGNVLLLILGKKYEPSINPFIILIFATYVTIWGLPYGNILSGMGKFALSAWIYVVKLLVFICSLTLFVSPWLLNLKASGVALNLLVVNLAVNGIFIYQAKKLGEIHLDFKNHFRHMVVIAISAVGYFLGVFLKGHTDYWWLLYIPAYLVMTYGVLILAGLIKKNHWLIIIDALNLRKTLNYAHDEIRGKEPED